MKIVRVQYTVKADFVERNRENISAVAEEVLSLGHPGISYSAYLLEDGKTFMHFDQFANEEAHLALQGLASFQKFDRELAESGWEIEPVLDILTEVVQTNRRF